MTMEQMLLPIRRYFDFSGRSSRSEYWMFLLFQILVMLLFVILGYVVAAATGSTNGEPSSVLLTMIVLLGIAYLALFMIPALAVCVRRFHDQDMSGWFYLLSFVPFGSIIIIVLMCRKGTDGPNRFGDDPLNPERLGAIFS
jgi:uncharacterized membrane protein YhaH (DUF805 family)